MANEVLKGSIFVDGVLSDLCGKRPFLAESTVGAWYYIKSVFFFNPFGAQFTRAQVEIVHSQLLIFQI